MNQTYTRDQIVTMVNRIMIEEFEAEPEQLAPDADLRDDIGLDSLDAVDLVVALEIAFGYRIPETEARDIRKLGDIHERIRSRIGAD